MHAPVLLSQASGSMVSMLLLHWHGWQAPPTSSGLPKKPDAHSSHRLPVWTNKHSGNCHHGSLVCSSIISKAIKTIIGEALTGSCLKKQTALGQTMATWCRAWMVPPRAPRHDAHPLSSSAVLSTLHWAPVIPHHTAGDKVHGHAVITHTSHSAWHLPSEATPINNPLTLVLWSHLTHINTPSPWEAQPNQPSLHTPTKYLCIPRYRHTRLAVWLDPGNSHWQTGVHSRGHQGKGRGGNGHLIPGWDLHSSQPGTCTTGYTACRDCRQTHCSLAVTQRRFSTTVKK